MSRERRLTLVLAINLLLVGGLTAVGLLAHSLAVLGAGADYLGDALGTGLSLAAVRVSRGVEGARTTSLAALANATLLLAVTGTVAGEAVYRLSGGAPEVHGVPVVIVSVIAAAAMAACAMILGEVGGDLNMESVMLDTLADAATAVGVAASGTVILVTHGNYWLDPAVALAIAVVVGYHAVRLAVRTFAALHSRD
jgi:cobalt-zinc-cadmium efflux system protein